jgi:hypothetical protein
VDVAHFVLNEFRERVANNTLETSVGETPFYSFNTNTLCAPEAATYRVADWVRNESFVCAVIRDSTGMGVRCTVCGLSRRGPNEQLHCEQLHGVYLRREHVHKCSWKSVCN